MRACRRGTVRVRPGILQVGLERRFTFGLALAREHGRFAQTVQRAALGGVGGEDGVPLRE